ncbi:hypothetical protein [Leifsonia poae]|uniref:hypothetical protein n=1 Tax=Leifsonia poae TaxID=110933 RepID=UPI003D67EA6E
MRFPNTFRRSFAVTMAGALLAVALAGCVTTPPRGLPSGFPTQVPVPSESVIASSHDDGTWRLTVGVDDTAAQRKALKELTDHGFEVIGTIRSKTGSVYSLVKGEYKVRVEFTRTDDDFRVTFGVAG